MSTFDFRLNETLYLKDPQTTGLGRKIISTSIQLIEKLGFEHFNFKKLAHKIDSTEASVYRYFENKHRLLLYLIDWYWMWMEHRIDFATNNISDPAERMKICLQILTEGKKPDPGVAELDTRALHSIVMSEFEKTYLTKQVDNDNKDGVFLPFKSLCRKIASLVKEINPDFPFPLALVSTLLLTINHQIFYAEHLPSLTDIRYNPERHYAHLNEFAKLLTFKVLQL